MTNLKGFPRPRWPWPGVLLASVVAHVLGVLLWGIWPAAGGWILGGIVLNHVGITALGLWPRSKALGPNVTCLPPAAVARGAVALTIDDGPDPEVTPAVLDVLKHHGVKASFFLIAQQAQAHPDVVRRIVQEGHDVQNHSWSHAHTFSLRGPAALRREIMAAQASLQALGGRRPHCFRAPAGLRNPCLDPVLHRLNLHLVSWSRRAYDTRVGDAARVLARLGGPGSQRPLQAGDIILLHDRHAARTPEQVPVILAVLGPLLRQAQAGGLHWETLTQALPLRHATDTESC